MKSKSSKYISLLLICVFSLSVANAGDKSIKGGEQQLTIMAQTVSANTADGPVLPLATGTFWQLGIARLDAWTDKQLADEVAVVKNAGMDVIMLQYGAVWDKDKERFHTYIPNAGFAPFPNLGKRDPLGAIFKAAEKLGVKIIIGDFLVPVNLRYDHPEEAFKQWMSPQAMEFRKNVINRYKNSPSFYGYYIANEPNPHRIKTEADKEKWFTTTKQVSEYAKKIHPGIKVIHSIGLYPEQRKGADGVSKYHGPATPAYLESFWGRWITEMKDIDIWMIIDGVGTKLAGLRTTDVAQAWGKEAVHRAGKEYWVDVENAVMSTKYHPFTIEELKTSLEIAAKHADKVVLFEHLNYMSPNGNRDTAKKLYDDYIIYRDSVLKR